MVLALKKLTIIQSLLYMLKFSLMNQNRERLSFLDNSFLLCSFPDSSVGEQSTFNEGDPGSIPGPERSPGEAKGYPLQYSGLKNSMHCIVHEVTKSLTFTSLSALLRGGPGFKSCSQKVSGKKLLLYGYRPSSRVK